MVSITNDVPANANPSTYHSPVVTQTSCKAPRSADGGAWWVIWGGPQLAFNSTPAPSVFRFRHPLVQARNPDVAAELLGWPCQSSQEVRRASQIGEAAQVHGRRAAAQARRQEDQDRHVRREARGLRQQGRQQEVQEGLGALLARPASDYKRDARAHQAMTAK